MAACQPCLRRLAPTVVTHQTIHQRSRPCSELREVSHNTDLVGEKEENINLPSRESLEHRKLRFKTRRVHEG
jgi:hypothetical protein